MMKDGPSHGSIIPGGIEAISSGTAITSRAVKAGLDVKHAGEVNDLAKAGNEVAKQIMDDAKEYLANFIGVVYGYADPEICKSIFNKGIYHLLSKLKINASSIIFV